jgi:hypothetical protein
VTEVFANLAAQAARARGFADLRTLVLPHPMETRSAEEIVAITRARLDEIVALLVGETPPAA